MASHYTAEDFVEVYHTDSTAEAHRILDTVLLPEGIQGVLHDRSDHVFPAPVAQPGSVAVAVPRAHAERAVEILKQADEDGYLQEGGAIISTPLV